MPHRSFQALPDRPLQNRHVERSATVGIARGVWCVWKASAVGCWRSQSGQSIMLSVWRSKTPWVQPSSIQQVMDQVCGGDGEQMRSERSIGQDSEGCAFALVPLVMSFSCRGRKFLKKLKKVLQYAGLA